MPALQEFEHRPRTIEHRPRDPRQAPDLDPIGAVGAPGAQRVEEEDLVADLAHLCDDRTVVTVENPSYLTLLHEVQFDTIYHEHFSYLTAHAVARLVAEGGPDRVVASSKTFRSIARLTGAAPSSRRPPPPPRRSSAPPG